MPDQPDNADASAAGRALAARRRRSDRACLACGTVVSGTARMRYCSPACRVKAAYYRSRGRELPPPTPDSP